MFAILEKLTEIKDNQVDKIKRNIETLPVLNEKLEQALKLCEEVETGYLEVQKVPCLYCSIFHNLYIY